MAWVLYRFFMFVGCVGMVGMPCPPIVWLRGYGRDAIPSYCVAAWVWQGCHTLLY